MTSSSAMRGSYYHASAYTTTCIELPQYYSGNHLSIHHPNSSHRDSSYPLSAAVFSPSLSESSYTGHPVTKGYEIEYNTDVQSKSCCSSEAQSRRGGDGMPYNDSTIKGGTQNNYTAEIRQNLAMPGYNSPANVPGHFRPLSAKFATPWYTPYLDASFEECQPTDFSSNGYSSIGSQFELDDSQILEGNFFMDPMFSQNLSSEDHYCPNSIAASQTVFENHLLPLIPSLPINRPVPPVDLIARTHMSGPCRDVSIPIIHPGRAVLPFESTTRLDPATKYSSAGLTTPWTISPSVAFAETTHLHQPSAFNNPCYNASLRAAGSHTPPHIFAASIGYPWNVKSADSIAMTEASADPDFELRCLGQVSFSQPRVQGSSQDQSATSNHLPGARQISGRHALQETLCKPFGVSHQARVGTQPFEVFI
ncbi:hypothetical protein HO173_009602 [Letharia columbiana]|uniref:Uncharacterized protein n=1 Tax=Letharia columbiana TaxID=112416 RepID=A0A8H6L1N6_9LECA|nr:uncharacterized protein HO173_009602 [Letharia columbiana]KAF6232219.1 hypothetical protein HO173_009602 [Letharia columbiana]